VKPTKIRPGHTTYPQPHMAARDGRPKPYCLAEKEMSRPPKRDDNHRIETRAVRSAISDMSPDWLVRSLEDRDYGVDLLIEFFADDRFPTGMFANAQSKGMEGKASHLTDGSISAKIPLKTLLYAQRISQPFFLLHTSLEEDKTYFAWLQRSIRYTLRKGWESGKEDSERSIRIPSHHVLGEGAGNRILEAMVRDAYLEAETLEGVRLLHWLELYLGSIAAGQLGVVEVARKHLTHLQCLANVIDELAGSPSGDAFSPKEIEQCLEGHISSTELKYLSRAASSARDFAGTLLNLPEQREEDPTTYADS